MSELLFCSLCDRSLPDADLRTGSAVRKGERALCGECLEVLSLRSAGKAGRWSPWLAVSGFIGLGVGLFLLHETSQGLASQQAKLRTDWSVEVEHSAERFTNFQASEQERRQEDLSLAHASLENLRLDLTQRMDELAAAALFAEDERAELQSKLETMLSWGPQIARLNAEFSVLEERQDANRSAQESLRDQLALMGRAVDDIQASAPDSLEEWDRQTSGLLRNLQEQDPEVRYSALESLSAKPDLRLLPHLYPLLSDPYEFTRFLAAHTFGDWDARASVPHLIQALNDEIAFVREASVRSLRRLTGQSFDFDHAGPESARITSHQRWEQWWANEGDAFLADG
ncbi:MAG: HEAT repeat domain-containing protein [Planctomycetes bacterium]|nr:HEAT repeat domain-containing protein [Planctomycetota bacterium]